MNTPASLFVFYNSSLTLEYFTVPLRAKVGHFTTVKSLNIEKKKEKKLIIKKRFNILEDLVSFKMGILRENKVDLNC